MITDPRSLLCLIEFAAQNWRRGNLTPTYQRHLLEGIYQVADLILAEYNPGPDVAFDYSKRNLEAIMHLAESGLTGETDLDECFSQINDSSLRVIHFPSQQ